MNPKHRFTLTRSVLVLVLLIGIGTIGLSGKVAGWAAMRTEKETTGEPAATQNQPQPLSDAAKQQIAALIGEKQSRSAAQKKLNSQLLFAIKMHRREAIAPGVQTLSVGIEIDNKERIEVDITATLGGTLIEQIDAVGGELVRVEAKYRKVRAKLPVQKIEQIAALPEVKFIGPKGKAIAWGNDRPEASDNGNSRQFAPGFSARAARVRESLATALNHSGGNRIDPNSFAVPFVGSQTSQGDATHRAVNARNTLGVSGAGVKIGVLSDGVTSLAAAQASGDLGAVTVLSGQTGTGDEGTAMLEIVHDLAPNAQLYFATAFTSAQSFADNIRALRAAGCDIIIDDVFYFDESPFQEGQDSSIVSTSNGAIIAQAVIDVTANGALYFSSAGNAGNKNDNTSGVWEGDFVDGGAGTGALTGLGTVHDFGGGALFNTITISSGRAYLFWSDPLAAASNDYDLYILDSTGASILSASTNVQSGTQDPVEGITASIPNNARAVIVRTAGAARYLHLNTIRGQLAVSTNGQTSGHSAVPAAFSCAATPAATAFGSAPNPTGPFPSAFSASNTVELFSSDGPRRVFFNSLGVAITTGNFSSTGGAVRAKPDITAADGVSVTGAGGFPSPFFGTSAAAPHAGAIAALVKQAGPSLTPAQIRTFLTTTAIDIETAGVDQDAGHGIIDALAVVQAVNPTPQALLALGTVTATEGSINNGNSTLEPGELGNIVVRIDNPSAVAATNVQATLSLTTPTPGVTILSGGPVSYGTIAAAGNASNTGSPFSVALSRSLACGTTIPFTLTVNFSGGASPATFYFQVSTGAGNLSITSSFDSTAPVSGPGYIASTGTQSPRLFRSGTASSCANPTMGSPFSSGNFKYDAYTFTGTSPVARCIEVTINQGCGTGVFSGAYGGGGFDPTNITANFLGDAGSSTDPMIYSFTVPANEQFTVVFTEVASGGNPTCDYTIALNASSCAPPPPCDTIAMTPMAMPAAKLNQAYSQSFTATGGLVPYTFTMSGALPTGLSFTNGVLSGTPTQAGLFPVSVTATNVMGCSTTTNYTIGVDAGSMTISDPLVCLGPGGLVSGTAAIKNPSGSSQNVAATISLPSQLLALGGRCTASTGTCTVVNASTISYSGTLAAGQTATLNYQTQVVDGTSSATQLCITALASFNSGVPVSVQACTTVNCPVVGPGSVANTTSPASDQKPGSVLFYNLYSSSVDTNRQNTRINMTNIHPSISANVHLFFVDGSTCTIADSYVCLTPNQTASFLTSDIDPGTTGYLVAVATDASGCPINFNYLIGDEYVKMATGHAANLPAEAITAIAGGLPACDTGSTLATLNFDGVSYNVVPRVLALDHIPSRADGNDTLLVLNRIGGNLSTGAATLTGIFGNLYDDAEVALSFSLSPAACQFRSSLSNSFPRTAPRFEQFIPAGRSGWLKLFSFNDQGMFGAAINLNANAASVTGSFNQGHNLHKLTNTAGMTYTIPVFPPSC